MGRMTLLVLSLIMPLGAVAAESEQDRSDATRVHLAAAASREVDNDVIRATLAVEMESPDAARLARRVNDAMGWALERARAHPAVSAESGNYQTGAVHQKTEFKYWRASQRLQLESRDAEALTTLVGELQTQLVLKDMQFTLSKERRTSVENSLITEAIDAFRARAVIVQQSLRAGDYRIRELNVNTDSPMVRPMAMAMRAEGAPGPQIEAGTTDISVTVTGTIEITEKD